MKNGNVCWFLFLVLMAGCLSTGCGARSGATGSAKDDQVVWREDFEDRDTQGWEPGWREGEYQVQDGVLTFVSGGGDIKYPSDVVSGTWGFDLFFREKRGITHEIRYTEGIYNYQMLEIKNLPSTQFWISTQRDPEAPVFDFVDLEEVLTGWQHIDITRDENGTSKVYLNGEFVLEHTDDRDFDAVYFLLYTCCEGPALDNVVVKTGIDLME